MQGVTVDWLTVNIYLIGLGEIPQGNVFTFLSCLRVFSVSNVTHDPLVRISKELHSLVLASTCTIIIHSL